MQTINTAVPLSTPEAGDLGVFLHRSTDLDGVLRFDLETQEGPMDAEGLAALRDLIALILDKPQRRQLTIAPDPSETPVVVSCVNVAGVQVAEYQSAKEGVTVALETDEVVPVRRIPELIAFLQSVEKDHRLAAARDFFGSEDALDLSKHTMQSLMEYAETHGYDVPAFLTVACEVLGK